MIYNINKLVFFDTECSNCYRGVGKMCEFGYVVTDLNFNVIKKDVIPMSPGKGDAKFDTKIYKREPGFQWAYDYDYYFSCKEFPAFYKRIKTLLEDENTAVVGFAVENDCGYVRDSCNRYKLDEIKYKAYDVRDILRVEIEGDIFKSGLQKVFKTICGADEFIRMTGHLSRDDAFMTMRIAQEVCKKVNKPIDKILDEVGTYEAHPNQESRRHHRLRGTTLESCRDLWEGVCRESFPKLEDESSIGKRCTISAALKTSLKVCTAIVDRIEELNLIPCFGVKDSDFMICKNAEDVERLKKVFKEPYTGKFVLKEDFLKTVEA